MKRILTCLCLLAASPAIAAEDEPYSARIDTVMAALGGGEREIIAASIRYPMRFWKEGEEIFVIGNPVDLLINYDTIFTPENIETLRALDTGAYARFTQGIMLGTGEIWFTSDGTKIRALNFFDTAPTLESAPFADAFARSKALGLNEFIWRSKAFTTAAAGE